MTGGLTNTKNFSPLGAPDFSTTSNRCSVSRSASSRGPVVPADSPQPPQHVAEMTAEDATIGVELVDDDVLQVLEEFRPARMVRQDARVHHVGVAQHNMSASANSPSRILRRIPVVREHADLIARVPRDRLAHRL